MDYEKEVEMLSYYKKIVQDDMEDIFDREIPFEKLENKSVLITGATGMLATLFFS